VNGVTTSAWREILERIFDGFEGKDNVSPPWLVNPNTGRRLKLDRYYPELGIAFRFIGLQGKQNYRLSDEELQEEKDRNNIRDFLCRQQGVTLIQLDSDENEPWRLLSRIRSAIGRTARVLAQSDVAPETKVDLAPRVLRAQRRCDEVLAQVRTPDGFKLYAELWQDRQYAPARTTPAEERDEDGAATAYPTYRRGMTVRHSNFGQGVVEHVHENGEDTSVTVRFEDGSERRFLAGLVGDKLIPQ
jgi:hypothetical protein